MCVLRVTVDVFMGHLGGTVNPVWRIKKFFQKRECLSKGLKDEREMGK
jgi:hypothetical protein